MISRKRFIRKVLPEMSVKIGAGATGFVASAVGGPVAGAAAGVATERLLRWTIGQFSDTYREAKGTIFDMDLGGKDKLEYNSVSRFWTRIEEDLAQILSGRRLRQRYAIDFWSFVGLSERERRKFGLPITLDGLLLPYGPLTPAHPMSRPGYSIAGWENMGDLGVEDTEAYDVQDAVLYGDRVLRLSKSKDGQYYGGLYDAEFGISNVALPLIVNEKCLLGKRKGNLHELWT